MFENPGGDAHEKGVGKKFTRWGAPEKRPKISKNCHDPLPPAADAQKTKN